MACQVDAKEFDFGPKHFPQASLNHLDLLWHMCLLEQGDHAVLYDFSPLGRSALPMAVYVTEDINKLPSCSFGWVHHLYYDNLTQ